MTLYATGARRAEAARLKITAIDSERMVVHIRGVRGRKDRDVMLSPALLDELRTYWRGLKKKPTSWLFPGNQWHTSSRPGHHQGALDGLSAGCDPRRGSKTGTSTRIPCGLATHLLEAGADLLGTIQILLGHRDLEETTIYLHLSNKHLSATASPLDQLTLESRRTAPRND